MARLRIDYQVLIPRSLEVEMPDEQAQKILDMSESDRSFHLLQEIYKKDKQFRPYLLDEAVITANITLKRQ